MSRATPHINDLDSTSNDLVEVHVDTTVFAESRKVYSTDLNSLARFIAAQMSEVGPVERVYSKHQRDVYYTWIVIPKRDEKTLDAIYNKEQQIIGHFPEYEFDFYVLYREGRNHEELVSGNLERVL